MSLPPIHAQSGLRICKPICLDNRKRKIDHRWRRSAEKAKVVGFGLAVLDHLLEVPHWPEADQKLCIPTVQIEGGGNCGNALTALSRLGLAPCIVTKLGTDQIGDFIEAELQNDGVDTRHVTRDSSCHSSSSYIVVDRQGKTRTCIYTEAPTFGPGELEAQTAGILENAELVYFDGWLTESAVSLARAARKAGIPVLVEAETVRPFLEDLLGLATYVSTSAAFPQSWTGEATFEKAVLQMCIQLPHADWVFTTRGAQGSILIAREPAGPDVGSGRRDFAELLGDLSRQLQETDKSQTVVCKSRSGSAIRPGAVVKTEQLQRLSSRSTEEGRIGQEPTEGEGSMAERVYLASAATVSQEDIRDTTGAGDASVGTLLYGILKGMPIEKMMGLAAIVSACKCTLMGARSGLPTADQIDGECLDRVTNY